MPHAERLRESKTIWTDAPCKNELILQCAGEGIFSLDNQGRMTFVNAAAGRMLGYTREDLGQDLAHDLIHHGKCDGRLCPAEERPLLAPCRDGTLHRNHDAVFWQKNGRPLEVQYTSAPIWEAGQMVGAVVVFSDNTARKQNEVRSARWQHIFGAHCIAARLPRYCYRPAHAGKIHCHPRRTPG